MMTLRAMTVGDIAAGMDLCRAAGWNQLEDDWRVFLESPGSGAFVAEKGDRVVGSAAFLRYDALAWIAMMLVDPAERGAGIGAGLMERALEALEDAECVGLDATPLGEPLYRRYGLKNDYSLVRTKATVNGATLGRYTARGESMRGSD